MKARLAEKIGFCEAIPVGGHGDSVWKMLK